jgi:UDP-glucose:(heptosyl)LPS alpha-1,3-glucosyltransferase
MHVALVHMRHAPTGGTERYLNQLAEHLAAGGHEVTIVCRSHAEAPHPAVRFLVLRDAVVGSAWRMWAFAKAVERHVRASSYDVVVGLGKTWTHDVIRLGGGTHRSYLELAHDATLEPWERATFKGALKQRLALRIEERALAPGRYVHVIANSHMVRRDVMERYGVPQDALTVVHNGVDLERFDRARHAQAAAALRRELGISADEPTVLFLGTGYGRKGLAHVLAAFPAVLRERPEARLVVAGRDSARGRYEHEARALGLGARATFLGERRDAEVVFAAADVYVLPTAYDPFANTTLEALASGLPVVTSDRNGGAEVLSEASGTVLGGVQDPDELAAALVDWTDPARLAAARDGARAAAEEHPRGRTTRESAAVIEACAARTR